MRTIMSYPAAFLGAALMLSLSACTTEFISGVGSGPTGAGGGGGGTTGSVTSTAQSTSTGGPTLLPAVARTRAQENALSDQWWSTHDPSSPPPTHDASLDPNDLLLRFSDVGVSCAFETVADVPCGPHYEMFIVLPSSLQQVGVYDLQSMHINNGVSERGAPRGGDPKDCSFGSGGMDGSFEIISIDATQVHFKVSGSDPTWESHLGGDFIAPRCP